MKVTTEDSVFYYEFNPFMGLYYNWSYELEVSIVIGNRYREAIALKNIARIYYHHGYINEVFTYLNKSLCLFRLIGDFYNEAMVLYDLARLYDDSGNLNKESRVFNHALSLNAYKACLQLFNFIKSTSVKQDILNSIGKILISLDQADVALRYYEKSLYLSKVQGDCNSQAITLNTIGSIYSDFSQNQKALDYFQKALFLIRQLADHTGEASILNSIGLVYSALKENNKALDHFQQALSLIQQLGDRTGEKVILNSIALAYWNLGKKKKVLKYYQQALVLSKEIGDQAGQADILASMGLVYSNLEKNQKALEHYEQALLLKKALGDRGGEANSLNSIGNIYSNLGENWKALEYYEQALLLNRVVGDCIGESISLNNIAGIYGQLGEKAKALKYYQKSLSLKKIVGDQSGEATVLNNIGLIYSNLGQKQKALEYYEQALPLKKSVGDQSGEATVLNNIGDIYSILGKNQKALEYYEQALFLNKAVGNRRSEATSLRNIGTIYSDLGDNQKALEYYEQGLFLNKAVGDRSGEITSLCNIGTMYSNLGQKQKALHYYEQSLSLSKTVGNRTAEANILSCIGFHLYFVGDQYLQACNNLLRSIELFELMNGQELEDNLKISFFDTYRHNYHLLQRFFISNNKLTLALEIAERGRARALVELLHKRFTNNNKLISTTKLTFDELKNIATIHNSTFIIYSFIPNFLNENTSGKLVESSPSLCIYVIIPNYNIGFREVSVIVNNLDLSAIIQAIRQTIRQPPGNHQSRGINSTCGYRLENLIIGDYVKLQGEFPTDEPWQIVAIDQDKHTVGLDQTRREEPLENVSISRIASKTDTSLRQLHQILIEPIADLLPQDSAERVIFMPQGALFGVPFAALQDAQGQYLIEKHTILTSPSIQVLAQTAAQNQRLAKQGQSKSKALVVGNPYPYPDNLKSLENASAEAQQIASLLGVQPLLGKKATEAEVLAQMPQADIIHFATHASFNDQRGLSSAIYLTAEPGAPDDGLFQTPGRITAEDIFNQFEDNPLNARLVVLSACDTGQGEITGDGVIGLSRSLIAGGVPSVLVSLWSVDDASTKTLMTEFYRQWQQQGTDKATALRNAMLETKAEYPDPYYWSGFTLIGEAE